MSIRDKRQIFQIYEKLLKLRRKRLTTKFKVSKIYKLAIQKIKWPLIK